MALTAALYTAPLELRVAVDAADQSHATRASLFLEVRDDDGEGWGECATAIARGADATLDEVATALVERVLETGMGGLQSGKSAPAAPVAVAAQVSGRSADVAAAGLVDAALLDLRLRRADRSLVEELNVVAATVGFAGVLGLGDPAWARARAAELAALGATRVRVKVAPASGTAAIEAVLDEVHVPVVADGNGAFRPGDDDAAIDALVALPLAWIEQPFAAGNLAGHAALAARSPVPLGLDESIRSIRSVRDAARYGAASVLCCKPARLGGIAKTREARREAAHLGLRTYVGGYFEAGLGRAVLGALAAEHDDGLDGDVVAPSTYLVSDPCALPEPVRGLQPLHRGPGCGPAPDRGALTLLARRRF